MPASPPPADGAPLPLPVIAARLRAAGCVFAEDEARMLLAGAGTPGGLAAMVDRRAAGFPLEQVLGWAEFCGLRVAVDPGVFVPRRRTEFLAREAARLAGRLPGAGGRPVVVLDLCCGSGAVGAAVASALPWSELHAVDCDPAAVDCARRNLSAGGGRVYQGDLYQPLPATLRGRVDVLVANAPYVPTESIGLLPPEARLHEARAALDGGPDGVGVQRRVIAGAAGWLGPGGHLLTETSEWQAPLVTRAAAGAGLVPRVAHCEDLDATVVIAAVPGPRSGQALDEGLRPQHPQR